MAEMYTQSIVLEEITREEYLHRAAALGLQAPSAGNGSAPETAKMYAKISNPLVHELNGEETKEMYCQMFSRLLEHPYCRQIRVRRGNEFVAKKQKNVRKTRGMEDLGYLAGVAAGGYATDDISGKDLIKLRFCARKDEPRSTLSFRRFGNKLAGYALEMQYCHRDLFEVRIDKEYSAVQGLWIPGSEGADTIKAKEAKSAEKMRTEAKDTEEMAI